MFIYIVKLKTYHIGSKRLTFSCKYPMLLLEGLLFSLMVVILNKQRMFVFFFLSGLQWIEHDDPLEAAEVDGWLLMRQLQLLNNGADFIKRNFSAHARK